MTRQFFHWKSNSGSLQKSTLNLEPIWSFKCVGFLWHKIWEKGERLKMSDKVCQIPGGNGSLGIPRIAASLIRTAVPVGPTIRSLSSSSLSKVITSWSLIVNVPPITGPEIWQKIQITIRPRGGGDSREITPPRTHDALLERPGALKKVRFEIFKILVAFRVFFRVFGPPPWPLPTVVTLT